MNIIMTGIAVCFVAYLGAVYLVDQDDKNLAEKKLVKFNSLDKSSLDYQAVKLLTEKGCGYCHTPNSEMPFYSTFPIAKQLMQADVVKAMRYFDMTTLLGDLQQKTPVSEVGLARLEKILNDNSMPPPLYLSMHWLSYLSNDEKQTLKSWILEKRVEKHANSPVTDLGKTRVLQPIYTHFKTDPAKVALGKVLYHDTRLSDDNTISCASCHNLATGGVDRLAVSVGIHGQKGEINAPTVLNSVYNKQQFWDGRAKDLQEQAGGPPFNPIEMGSTHWNEIVDKLSQDTVIANMFTQIYQDSINGTHITDAIAEFEKTLTTPNSRFDKYLMGNNDALTTLEKAGLKLFEKYNCHTCHAGEAMGGETYETMGLKFDYFADRGKEITNADLGRFNFTKNDYDKYKFKVPTLRNIALTAPYFHDASADTLEKAIYNMGKYQIGVSMSDKEVSAISAFLQTLTGELEGLPLANN